VFNALRSDDGCHRKAALLLSLLLFMLFLSNI